MDRDQIIAVIESMLESFKNDETIEELINSLITNIEGVDTVLLKPYNEGYDDAKEETL